MHSPSPSRTKKTMHRTGFLRGWFCTAYLHLSNRFGNRAAYQRMIADAQYILDPDRDEENMPYWAASEVLDGSETLEELNIAKNRFEGRIYRNRPMQKRWEEMIHVAREATPKGAYAHFEQTTGHSILELPQTVERNSIPPMVLQHWFKEVRGKVSVWAPPIPRLLGVNGRMVVATFACYLFLVSFEADQLSTTPQQILHEFPQYSWVDLGRTPRGAYVWRDNHVSWNYVDAMYKLRKAQASIWAFVPGVRRSMMDEGILALENAIAFQREGGLVYSEALMMLANAYAISGQSEKAMEMLQEVIDEGYTQRVDAQKLKIRLLR